MGCPGSKPNVVAPPAAARAAQPTPAAQKDPNLLVVAKPAEAKPTTSLKIYSAHGLRSADLVGNKSDVYVEVEIEGKSDSKVTTAVVTGTASKKEGAGEKDKASIDVEFKFVGELKGYVAGDKVLFTVKDKDFMTSGDCLGKATVAESGFGGKLVLEGAGEGFQAHLMVQLGDGTGMDQALKASAAAAAALVVVAANLAAANLAANGDRMKQAEAAKAAQAAVDKIAHDVKDSAVVLVEETRGDVCCGC